jgi:hypothetical protein
MALIKHVVDEHGVGQDIPMTPEEEAEFLAGQAATVPKKRIPPLSRRQFYQQLAKAGTITQAEALAAVRTGAVPAALGAFITSLPAEQQFDAEMILSGADEFRRDHPYVNAIAAAQGMDEAQVDAFFTAAGAL